MVGGVFGLEVLNGHFGDGVGFRLITKAAFTRLAKEKHHHDVGQTHEGCF